MNNKDTRKIINNLIEVKVLRSNFIYKYADIDKSSFCHWRYGERNYKQFKLDKLDQFIKMYNSEIA